MSGHGKVVAVAEREEEEEEQRWLRKENFSIGRATDQAYTCTVCCAQSQGIANNYRYDA